jgi:glutamate synthase domain-containing protein 2/glutamate synthase domain-containing protein 1/glutamate synthase domain-containing protein 3
MKQRPTEPTDRPAFAGGVHDPAMDRDSCGVAAVARLDNSPRHEVVARGLIALDRLEHRGAAGADETTGDGAGILLDLSHDFFRFRAPEAGVRAAELPGPGELAVAVCFLPKEPARSRVLEVRIEQLVSSDGHKPITWREVPVEETAAGTMGQEAAPRILQLLIGRGDDVSDQDEFERRLFLTRRRAEAEFGYAVSFPSFSSRTIVYKGMLTAPQLPEFYPDLTDSELKSRFAVVHSRFSTNTLPSWELAQPLRLIAHNGEINTALGNVNWMRAREATLSSSLLPGLEELFPLIPNAASDSAAFDRALELLTLAGRTLPHAMMMMIPQAYKGRDDLPPELEGFYRYHSRIQEPWDGPAAMAFCDGQTLGAMVDRNGLRPGRWLITDDGWLAMGSESGIFTVSESKVFRKGRFRPGQLVIADLATGVVHADGEVELQEARRHPYGDWDTDRTKHFDEIEAPAPRPAEKLPMELRQLAFGYSQEDLRILLEPLVEQAKEPTGSMGNDVSLAAFSEQEPSLFSYFKQRFAQVTNPAIDSVRETVVMSLTTRLGAKGRLLFLGKDDSFQIEIDQPILTNEDIDRLRNANEPELAAVTIDATWPLAEGPAGMQAAIERICTEADEALAEGATMLIISDHELGPERVPIPSLLASAAVHQSMVRKGTRLQASLIIESGEPREVHHLAALIGYGATAINPYLMLESIAAMDEVIVGGERLRPEDAVRRAIVGLCAGLLKVLSKMGISTIHSYRGAQVFEAVGIDRRLIDEHFTGTPSRLGGIGVEGLAREALARHARAWPEAHGLPLPEHVEEGLLAADHAKLLPQGGVYRWRRDGELHMWDPQTIASLQRSVRDGDAGLESYEEFSRRVNEENAQHALLRGLLGLRTAAEPIPLEEVEPATEIVRRFSTGAMSLGALSREAHETLAIAMNRIGGMSNSGEGGEDPARNTPDENGDQRRSRIRQVASGRFGVDIDYLSRADQLQIKVAQGAKPGEGGQLPGHKVDSYIASLRHSTPGVELISPPPHHDIYSIEDLKQLIYDLRAANPRASVSVKLAAEAGVGTVAAGVVKAGADHIVIAGHDGGTGASPQSSIQQAGVPWELGIAEAQQALLDSELRSRVVLQADGQMRTGRDIVIAALLGADEVGLSTAPLIATGCIMMRVCHLNTCPVGVATQDPELRRRFQGTPEQVVTYMLYVAEEARRLMAGLGIRRFADLVGRTHLLDPTLGLRSWKTEALDLRPLLAVPPIAEGRPKGFVEAVDHGPADRTFDGRLLIRRYRASEAPTPAAPLRIRSSVVNSDLAVGGSLSNAVVADHGPAGLPDDSIQIQLQGSAGQSCGAWLAPGISLTVEGDVNDYAGKGLSGGVLAVHPAGGSHFVAADNVIAGNVTLYGATRGRAFFNGRVGERFAVRNSGALAVVEGVGEHACEYMTGGCVVVIGPTGQNFGAGMSGGVAFVHNPDRKLAARTNHQLVDLDPLNPERESALKELLTEHLNRTGSEVARELLDRWAEAVEEFTLVIPRGYKEAMARFAAERSEATEPEAEAVA